MSITTTQLDRGVIAGGLRYVLLKCVDSSAGTADEVATGLNRVIMAIPTSAKAAAVDAAVPAINETYPLESGSLTVIADASDEFYIFVLGQ